ncbi:MAG: PEP-CTERM sorting domain-containing protein [Gomphosphaeria aponina SAG 52.96 = DSM 107014]|uniref:PEP-CTERM sorting domain-containing protein n=1 Tax=Gomphosphaeria aponina SAG 52.96 = DSM 107014 TaxID=1521640 RepID=A0A941GVW7_9CHRO|nr:PEP-CTERM sorting domain-containing protein [Gomphosphaeria aponina SAG 52.96 = DSM 107014]
MKNLRSLSTFRVTGLLTFMSVGLFSVVAPAGAVDLKPLVDSRFDFGSQGNIITTNNVFDFTNDTSDPVTPSPGQAGKIDITFADGGFNPLFSAGSGSVKGATAEVKDVAFGFALQPGVVYKNFGTIEGFYDNFKDATGANVNIRFDANSFQATPFGSTGGAFNFILFNVGGDIVDKDSGDSIPVDFTFTSVSGQLPPSPNIAELPFVPVSQQVVAGNIPNLGDVEPTLSTSYSGTVRTIPEPMTMLGSAAAIGFGYFSKKRRASK